MDIDSKKTARDIFRHISEDCLLAPPEEAFEIVGAAVGMFAYAYENVHGVDRNVTFKMVQRIGHKVIQELANIQANKKHDAQQTAYEALKKRMEANNEKSE